MVTHKRISLGEQYGKQRDREPPKHMSEGREQWSSRVIIFISEEIRCADLQSPSSSCRIRNSEGGDTGDLLSNESRSISVLLKFQYHRHPSMNILLALWVKSYRLLNRWTPQFSLIISKYLMYLYREM